MYGMFDPRLIAMFEEKHGEGSFLRFIGLLVLSGFVAALLLVVTGIAR